MAGSTEWIAALEARRRRVLISLAAAIAVTLVALLVVGLRGPGTPSRISVGRDATTLPGLLPGAPGAPDSTTTSSSSPDTSTTSTTVTQVSTSSTSSTAPDTTTTSVATTSTAVSTTVASVPACKLGDLTLSASAKQTGPAQEIDLSETNTSGRVCSALQGTSRVCIGGSDVVLVSIVDQKGTDVYSAPAGGCHGSPPASMALRPGDRWAYALIWDQRSCPATAGTPSCPSFNGPSPAPTVAPGVYTAHTVWTTTGTAVPGPDATINITG